MFGRINGNPQSGERTLIETLVEKSIKGDIKAFGDLCGKISGSVIYQVSCLLSADEGTEDVAQEVLLTVCKGIQSLREPKAFSKWLSTIIIREKNKYLTEKLKRGVVVDIDDYLEQLLENRSEHMPTVNFENEELCKTVKRFVAELPERQKEAVILRYYNEFSVADTAEIMGVTVQCASQHLALAAKKIKRRLEEDSTTSERSLSAMAAMPVGAVLSGALQHGEAFYISANQAVSQSIIAKCQEYAFSEVAAQTAAAAETTAVAESAYTATAAKATTGISSTAVSYICAVVLTVAAVVGVYLAGSGFAESQPQPASIVFYGGSDHGGEFAHVNPERIYAVSADMEVSHWWITPAGCDQPLAQGNENCIGSALTQLGENGVRGEFLIHYTLVCETWEHTVYQNFYILPDTQAS